ncbi:hypothetical protein [Trichlorobacter lovleyi]|uniref:Uncharacterized protein n=1 Tax=Trichlorobacter lovleyi (strain ATCC BAA-1151 / DSM 17278 / SZ) TaxID=398767 RepID=B3E897_TRIL1|nr:hypothetical protein [Trichlorobacter lovleyi]ACD95134.1 conserved hypothetical protein [Trichlorobacter lovleyi SZ]
MPKYTGSADVYRELVEDSKENWLYGLVAFAVVEEQRIEWMKHYESQNGRMPDDTEIKSWYEQQPDSVLLRAKGTAENALQTFSAEVLEVANGDIRKEIEESVVISEIKKLGSFWPQFGVNLAGGFCSALLFAAFLIVMAFLVLNDTSPVEIGKKIKPPIEEKKQ